MEQKEWLVVRRISWCTVDNILIRAGQKVQVDSSDGRSSSIRCAKSLESFFMKKTEKIFILHLFSAWPVLRLRSRTCWTEIWLNIQFKCNLVPLHFELGYNTFVHALYDTSPSVIFFSLVSGEQQSNKQQKYWIKKNSKSCHHYAMVVDYLLSTWWDIFCCG